jgi:hypothetical protein
MNKKLEAKTRNLGELMRKRYNSSWTIDTFVDTTFSTPLVGMYVSFQGIERTFFMGDKMTSVAMRAEAQANISEVLSEAVKNLLAEVAA